MPGEWPKHVVVGEGVCGFQYSHQPLQVDQGIGMREKSGKALEEVLMTEEGCQME